MSTNQREFYIGLERASAASVAASGPTRARAVHETVTAKGAPPAACRSGCDHCCHFPVGVRFDEIMLLAATIRADEALRRRIRREAEQTERHAWEELAGRPCPLLINGHCARYDARPTPCRALRSFDAHACEQALTGRAPVPRDEQTWWRGLGAASLLDDQLGARELRSALAATFALEDDADPHEFIAAFKAARAVGDGES